MYFIGCILYNFSRWLKNCLFFKLLTMCCYYTDNKTDTIFYICTYLGLTALIDIFLGAWTEHCLGFSIYMVFFTHRSKVSRFFFSPQCFHNSMPLIALIVCIKLKITWNTSYRVSTNCLGQLKKLIIFTS